MKLFKLRDLIIIAAVLAVAALLCIPKFLGSDNLIARVYVDGNLEREIDLSEVQKEYTFSPDCEPKTEITVGKGEIYFSGAECNDKLCIKSGKLTSGGQSAACLPARVVISVVSERNKTDVMTY